MSNIRLIKKERETQIGNFSVERLLPFREKRAVGPFVFIDRMGPLTLNEHENFDVPPHPHIGLSTLTYLFEGCMMHKDSIGTQIEINPGAVNLMTAGKGIVHSERTPERLRNQSKCLHGLQIWIALPKHLEETEPSFTHTPKEDLPVWENPTAQFKLIAGTAFDKTSPVPVHSPLYFIEIKSKSQGSIDLNDKLFGESALYILEGSIIENNTTYNAGHILIPHDNRLCNFTITENATVYIFGGEPFPEKRYMDWNFVSSDKARLTKAKKDWINQQFPKI